VQDVLPTPLSERSFLFGGGECGRILRGLDWRGTPLGDPSGWPSPLRTLVGIMLGSTQPMLVVWGPSLTTLYNDAYSAMCGARHPASLGGSFADLWHDVWDQVEPILSRAYAGEPTHMADIAFTMHRNGYPEETHFAFGYSPVRDDAGDVAGMFCSCVETTAQVLAERRLRESEARSSSVLERMAEGFLILDADFRIRNVNAEGLRIDGRPASDLVGRSHWEAYPGTGESELGGLYRTAMDDRVPVALHHRYTFSDGVERWLEMRAHPLEDGGLAVFYRDVSDRMAYVEDLRRSEAELRLVADALPVLIAFIGPDLVYRFANEAYRDWFGKAPSDIVGTHILELVGKGGVDRRLPYIARALAGEEVRLELDWPHADGRERVADIRYIPRRNRRGEVDGFYTFVIDVTDRKRAEGTLRSMNESLSRQVEAHMRERERMWRLTTDVLLVARFDGRIEAVNPAWTGLFGWAEADLANRSFLDLVHPDDVQGTLDAMGTLSEGGIIPRFENRYRGKDGSYRWISWTAVPDASHIHAIGRDVQSEKESAEALRVVEEALRQSQKMEAVGQLTGGLAHDFNNLLTAISGSLELLQSRIAQGRLGEIDRYVSAAQGASRRAAALTHRLLAFSRRQTLDPRPTDVNLLVSGMEELVRRTVGPTIEIAVTGEPDLRPAMVDPHQLENALLNLCINARDAMPDGGAIRIGTAQCRVGAREAGEWDLEPGTYLCLTVTDTGTGMSPDVMGRAFEPFFTTKPLGEGTGLGLSMIYGFARQSGGQVRIESEVGHGTTMRLYLPRHACDAVPEVPCPDQGDDARISGGETILVVDDESTVRMLVAEVLEDLGYRVIEAGDGAAGLRILRSDARVDFLVSDVGLPGGMNGRQMADAARVSRPDLKVLFITGYAEAAVVGNGSLAPGMQVMTKPFVIDLLVRRVQEAMAG
jgi:PAS domain S-box-containing protein